MKQLLLRVDDELHARLAAQARALGKSVNALANDILGLGIDPSNLTRRDQLQLKLMALGTIGRSRNGTPFEEFLAASPEHDREEQLARARERIGPPDWVDDLIGYERGHDRLP